MKIAFVSLPVAGHLNPMSALAARVQSDGNEVVFISVADAEARAVAAGLRFVTVGTDHLPLGSTKAVEQQFSTIQGGEGLKFTFDLMGMITGALIRPVESVLASERVDGVVFDTYQPYMELSALALNLPYIHVANAVPFDVSGATPLCFFDWGFADSVEAKRRNLEGVEAFRKLLEPSLQVAKEYASERQIVVDWDDLATTRSKLGWITQLPMEFDFGTIASNDALTHTGPFVNEGLRPSIAFPWAELKDVPLVYASMGTLQNGIESVFCSILDAAKRLEHLQFVVAVGDKLDQASFQPLPGNVLMAALVPQLELLKRASLCITHAGLNTVLEALTYGVPLVALPVTNDQPGVAARIRDKGIGEFISPSELSADRLSFVIQQVLGEPGYLAQAQRMASAISVANGISSAAHQIESAFTNAAGRQTESRQHAELSHPA
jgi:zeaxanthin glucosyltransferase